MTHVFRLLVLLLVLVSCGSEDVGVNPLIHLLEAIGTKRDGRLLDPRHGGDGQLGRTIAFPPLTVAGGAQPSSTQPLIQQVAANQLSPEVFTVDFPKPFADGDAPDSLIITQTLAFNAFASVTWGSGNTTGFALVDITNGTQITVAGSAITIKVTLTNTSLLVPLPAMHIGALLSYNTRPSSSFGPSFTNTTPFLNNGITSIVNVPPFAKDVTITAVAAADVLGSSPAFDVFFQSDNTGAPLATSKYVQAAASPPLTVPIPGWAQAIKVKNNAGAGTSVSFSLRFGLAL